MRSGARGLDIRQMHRVLARFRPHCGERTSDVRRHKKGSEHRDIGRAMNQQERYQTHGWPVGAYVATILE